MVHTQGCAVNWQFQLHLDETGLPPAPSQSASLKCTDSILFGHVLLRSIKKAVLNFINYFLRPELRNETNTAGDVPIMMMQILTTLMKGMPNSTRRQKDSMGNIQLKLNRIWKEEQLSNPFRNCLEA